MEVRREVWEGVDSPSTEFTQESKGSIASAESQPYLTAKLLAPLKELVSNR
jgi:hypothetical protein